MPASTFPSVLFLCTGNYYRSRFAELVFNHLAAASGLAIRADSAGFACWDGNVGPLSSWAREGLEARGIAIPEPCRFPRVATEEDLARVSMIVALHRIEHEPMIAGRFPRWLPRVRFWDVADVAETPPAVALPAIEAKVSLLLEELRHAETFDRR
ncbi:MAG TPA: hypothetical protein VJT73_13415 [Polyangiaceae bacterium]|nr:hypothetical protein [Polyangiaceae bacterium]